MVSTVLARASARSALAVSTLAVMITPVCAQQYGAEQPDSHELIELINSYRESGQSCAGQNRADVAPLTPNENLAKVELSAGASWQQVLREAGYQASKIQAMQVAGPSTAQAALDALRGGYCQQLLAADYADIGVSRDGRTWQVVLAKPLVSDNMGDWEAEGKAVLDAVNQARSQARRCGSEQFQAASPLQWSQSLGKAALVHSQDMAEQGYFSHSAPNGGLVSDRVQDQGYAFSRVGENLGFGQSSAQQVVQGWLLSPGHCANLMNPDFTEMGAAYALKREANRIYWTQVLGTPR